MNFPYLDGDVPRSISYDVYISQLIRFARVSSHVDGFNNRNKVLTTKFSAQDIDIMNFESLSQNFIGSILTQCLNIMLVWKHFFCKAFQILYFMTTWCINSEKNNR